MLNSIGPLLALVAAIPDGLVAVTEDCTIALANEQIEVMFGYSSAELLDQSIDLLLPERIREILKDQRASSSLVPNKRTMGSGLEVFGRRKDGSEFPVDISLSSLEIDGHRWEIAIIRDIAERKRIEQITSENAELAERTAQLSEAKNEAERANSAKSEFLSRMSHELRTPLNAILGYAQLLDMQQGDRKVKDAAHAILKGGTHLLEMINEVLDHSRIESGHIDFSLEPVPLARTLNQAIELVQTLAEASHVSLTVVQIDHKIHVQADRQRLLQVFINLLSNAIKYNRPGGSVTVSGATAGSDRFYINFEDTGKGISPENQKTLFVPFQRYGDTTVEGTGLGLTLSERFVRLMGGKLSLQSSSTEGSIFCVELSVTSLSYNIAENQGDECTVEMLASGARGVVLYIEDNLSNLKLMESVLENIPGIQLVSATNGEDALKLAFRVLPDLVLLDIHLPGMKAEDIFRTLRSDPRTSGAPVVILSADATDRQIKHFKDLGVEEYLTKPLQLKKFLDVLDGHLLLKKDFEAYRIKTKSPNAVI